MFSKWLLLLWLYGQYYFYFNLGQEVKEEEWIHILQVCRDYYTSEMIFSVHKANKKNKHLGKHLAHN
jgi:hypothetical protein